MHRILFIGFIFMLINVALDAQELVAIQDTIPVNERLIIENSGSRIVESTDTGRIQFLYEDVRAFHDSTYFYADTAILTDAYLIAYGNMVIIQKDTIRLFGDSLYFDRDSSLAEVYGDVVLENGTQRLSGNSLFYLTDEKIAYYSDTAILEQGTMKLQSLIGTFYIDDKVGKFKDEVYLIDRDTRLRTDSMTYYTEEEKAEFSAPTRIKTIDAEIYCEEGYYIISEKKGRFTSNAQYKGENRSVVGDEILYDKLNDNIRVIGNATFVGDEADGIADEMEYSEQTKDLILIGQAVLQDSSSVIGGEKVVYNQDDKDLFIAGNGFLWKDDWSLNATNIEYNDTSGVGIADGEVIYVDSTSNTSLYCDEAHFNNSIQYMKAFNYVGRPYLKMISDQDTTTISSDTIISYEITDTLDNTSKFLVADNRAGIFKKDMQAVCDSFTYKMADSTFVLIGMPIMWSDTTQFTGDTILLIQRNDKLDKMVIQNNVMIINSIKPFYNQIRGKRLDGYFLEEEIDRFTINGSAQSIYYMADDDDAFIGVNTTECSILKFNFEDNEISDIRGYTDVSSKLIPIEKANHEELKLQGFRWQLERKPTSANDVINIEKNL